MHRLRLALLTAVALVLTVALVHATRSVEAEVAPASGPATATVPALEPAVITDGPPLTLRLMTYNLLGSHHTEPGGMHDEMAPSALRSQWGADLVRDQRADVVGMQEVRPEQIAAFQRELPGYDMWPVLANGSLGRPNQIIWNASRFTRLDAGYVEVPSMGETRRMPYVLLKDRSTARTFWYFNIHNSPGDRQAERDRDLVLETAKINELRADGTPVFLGGDFNETSRAMCTVLARTDLESSAGGIHDGTTCKAPSGMRIDWIFGNGTFSAYAATKPPLARYATDHWIVATSVRLD
ncbi:endonuclease/exonuclease/phosphatase family protein [Nocardioides aurantiacus]|uniref:Endonuclease/exonuclease/phosphatase family metal-dependent hydrolase n=1 Tax=Nocardioides aurantiacus TaxID=86796 RepID=A0A3N2CYA1_9ACTN|nr:endonuclease/exonuclease/phosphatase family protein [Nocardioides aurantiacus]ROR92408.1 endonuclease/exonuclease/phosphatase family metal-dependent hydrolase [Nocardioides aurantiacus]